MEARNSEQLVTLLREILARRDVPAVIQAGHYALDIRDSEAEARLDESASTNSLAVSFGAFARVSWSLACRMASECAQPPQAQEIQLMTLVNDWQFVGWGAGTRREQAKRVAQARRRYYEEVPTLPPTHLAEMQRCGLDASCVVKWSPERWLFSEDDLRTGLARTLRRLKTEGRAQELGIVESMTQTGEPIIRVRSTLDDEVCLLYCGNANCAGEVVELLRILRERGVKRFVNLFPRECMVPVEAGTSVAHDLFGLDDMQVVNAGLSISSGAELEGLVSVHDL